MKLLPSLLAALTLLPLASLQAQSSDLVPKKPILPRAPGFASWTVTFKYKGEGAQAPLASTPSDQIRTVTVTKTNKTYWEQVTLVSGEKYEKWIFEDAQLKSMPNSPSILLIPPPSVDPSHHDYSDYQKSDFPDLSWVSLQNFTGVSGQSGKSGFHFAAGNKVAILSTETQLPVYFAEGDVERVYVFNPAPTKPLSAPKAFLDVLQTHRRGVEALKYHPIPM